MAATPKPPKSMASEKAYRYTLPGRVSQWSIAILLVILSDFDLPEWHNAYLALTDKTTKITTRTATTTVSKKESDRNKNT